MPKISNETKYLNDAKCDIITLESEKHLDSTTDKDIQVESLTCNFQNISESKLQENVDSTSTMLIDYNSDMKSKNLSPAEVHDSLDYDVTKIYTGSLMEVSDDFVKHIDSKICSNDNILQENVQDDLKMMKNISSLHIEESHTHLENGIRMNSTHFCSNVTFHFITPCDDTLENNVEIKIPEPWGLQKLFIEKEEVLVMRYIIENRNDSVVKHNFQKTVLIKPTREIIYEVFSKRVDVPQEKLPKMLNNMKQLPQILKKFKDFKVCKGVVATYRSVLEISVVQTCTGTDVRHKNYSLLSYKSERCRSCKLYSAYFKKAKQQKKISSSIFIEKFRRSTKIKSSAEKN